MSREETFETIERFCATPKSSREIAKHLGIEPSSVYGYLSSLQRRKRLEKRGDDKHRVTPATFVTLRPKAAMTLESENLMITHAHNPFGLKT